MLVSYPHKGTYSVAFLTSESPEVDRGGAGQGLRHRVPADDAEPDLRVLLIVPEDEVIPLDMTVDEGLKLVISAGALSKNGSR